MAVFATSFKIYSFQADFNEKATFITLCQWLQEAAILHADSVGFGTRDLHKLGLFWAINRWAIVVNKYPVSHEEVIVQTWVSSQKGPFTEREYHMFDGSGKESLVRASSLWFAVDLDKRKPVPISKITERLPVIPGKKSYPNMPEKVKSYDSLVESGRVRIKLLDLDYNRHANNVKYLEWILSTLDSDRYQHQEIRSISINYIAEALIEHGEVVVETRKFSDTRDFHQIVTQQGNVLVRMETSWRKIGDP